MPRTRGESIFFTAITAWMMVYAMTLYNTVLATGSFTNATFLIALKGMWIEYIIIALLAYFVSGHLAKMCAFRVVQPGNFKPDYLTTYCRNFVMAFPLQLIIVGPLARLIFRILFIKHGKADNTNEIQNEDEQIVEKAM